MNLSTINHQQSQTSLPLTTACKHLTRKIDCFCPWSLTRRAITSSVSSGCWSVSLRIMGRLTPVTTSIGALPRKVQARLVGVPPNMSVNTKHARALVDALDRLAYLVAGNLDVVVPADSHGR